MGGSSVEGYKNYIPNSNLKGKIKITFNDYLVRS